MAKFSEIAEGERIVMIKDELVRGIEELMLQSDEIKKLMPEDQFKNVMEYLPQLKVEGCQCGTCIDISKLESRIPRELQPMVVVAKKRCEARTY